MRRRGFTLLEALFSVVILGGLVALVCAVFEMGAAGYRRASARLDLQGEARRILTPLRKELKNSSFLSVSSVSRVAEVQAAPPNAVPLVQVRRDGVCFNALNSRRGGAYSARGLPRWNCYVLYFATLDNPNGHLVRTVLSDPSNEDGDPTNDTISLPRNLGAGHLSASNPDMLDNELKRLSAHVMEFGVTLNQAEQYVEVQLKIRGSVGRSTGRKSTAEVLELRSVVRSANTWPRM